MRNHIVLAAIGAAIVASPAGAQPIPSVQRPPMAQGHGRGGWQEDMTRSQAQQRADMMFQRLDLNHDGTVTRQEAEQAMAQFGGGGDGGNRAERMISRVFGDAPAVTLAQAEAQALARFDRQDLNHDGVVTAEERQQARAQR